MGSGDYAGPAAIVAAVLVYVVLGAFAPDLLAALGELFRWGVNGTGY